MNTKQPPELPGYKLFDKIGEGGMSSVWRAWDIANSRVVAIKLLDPSFSASAEDINSFYEEESMMAEIHHPGIVQAYAIKYHDGIWFLVLEYVDGYTFADLLRRKQHIEEADCLLICESVAAALDVAWNDHGVVHCDIKPENIMINTEGIVKLTDLGISHRFQYLDNGSVTVPDHVQGTPAYISPEQIYGDVEPDCRCDIYSLAATLYHLATGKVLFPNMDNETMMRAHCDDTMQAIDPRALRPSLSEGFCQMLEAMLVKNRDERIPTWQDVFAMCNAVENGAVFTPRETESVSSIRLMG